MKFVLRDSISYFEIRNKTGFRLSKGIPLPTWLYDSKGRLTVNTKLEEEIERLRKVAKVRNMDYQESDMPYSIALVSETRMEIKP